MKPPAALRMFLLAAASLGAALALAACGKAKSDATAQAPGAAAAASDAATPSVLRPGYLVPRTIGNPARAGEPAWITDLTLVDLDHDGRLDVVCCDGRANRVCWLRQTAPGVFEETFVGDPIAGPAHVEAVDLDGDGDLDLVVGAMGIIPPSTARLGAVIVLENDGQQHFANRTILADTYRVNYVTAADLNGDGKLDLVVGQFGYLEGQVQWLENQGGGRFASHILLDLPGAIAAPVVDFNGDGIPEIVALISQDTEEIYAFEQQGDRFKPRVLYGSPNPDYGSSGLVVADVDRDGDPDLVYTNGDGFDYATPGARPWHGVQWLENNGHGQFAFHRLGDFSGAYSPVVVDLDGDGDNDVVAVSAFADWKNHDTEALVCFENRGSGRFSKRVLAHEPTHLVVAKAGDLDGDGRPELVTGCFAFYPPTDRAARVVLWERKPHP